MIWLKCTSFIRLLKERKIAKFSQPPAAAKNNQISKKATAKIEQKHTNIISHTNTNILSIINTNTNTDIPWLTNVFFLSPHLRFDLAKKKIHM